MSTENSQKDASVKGYWSDLKGALLEAINRSCGRTKSPASHKETWRWNDVSNSVSEKQKLWKEWKRETKVRRNN